MNDITSSDSSTFPYIFHQNVSIVPEDVDLPVRINVYRPKTGTRVPVLITFGPYGKDTPYAVLVNKLTLSETSEDTMLMEEQIQCTIIRRSQSEAKERALRLGDP